MTLGEDYAHLCFKHMREIVNTYNQNNLVIEIDNNAGKLVRVSLTCEVVDKAESIAPPGRKVIHSGLRGIIE